MEKKKVDNGLAMPIWSGGNLIVTPLRRMIHRVLETIRKSFGFNDGLHEIRTR